MDIAREKSEFNQAISYLGRLNILQYMCDDYAMNNDPFGWYNALLVYYRELAVFMNVDERKKAEDFKLKIRPLVNNQVQRIDNFSQSNKIPAITLDSLHDFDIFLRDIQKASGLLTKEVDDAMRALK